MKTAVRSNANYQLRRFKVGLVGANNPQKDALARIFTLTQYRVRGYEVVPLESSELASKRDVDFVLMCSTDPVVIKAWARQADNEQTSARPLIHLSRTGSGIQGKYQLNSPVNPGKLIKLLDRYTIKELNFFPEFEIGHESDEVDDAAAQGLNILRSASNRPSSVLGCSRRAMVVDDSLAVRRQMQIEFELLNDAVDLFDSAESAMVAINKRRYDIIFLDVVMPGMDGHAACKMIKRSALNRSTPVIMLTSRSSSFDKIKGSLAGCSAYLVKPVNHNEFDAIYRKYTKASLLGSRKHLRPDLQGDNNASQQGFGR